MREAVTAAASADFATDIRPATEADMRFVRETSCKVRWPHRQPFTDWEAQHGPTVDYWIADGQCLVADAGGTVLGFAIVTPIGVTPDNVVRMVYVKRAFRGDGIGLALLTAAGCVPPFVGHLPTPQWFAWTHRIGRRAA